jgi:hypothetical protein
MEGETPEYGYPAPEGRHHEKLVITALRKIVVVGSFNCGNDWLLSC